MELSRFFCYFICQLGELTNTRVSCSEPVLEWGQYLVRFKVVHHNITTDNYMLHYITLHGMLASDIGLGLQFPGL